MIATHGSFVIGRSFEYPQQQKGKIDYLRIRTIKKADSAGTPSANKQ